MINENSKVMPLTCNWIAVELTQSKYKLNFISISGINQTKKIYTA